MSRNRTPSEPKNNGKPDLSKIKAGYNKARAAAEYVLEARGYTSAEHAVDTTILFAILTEYYPEEIERGDFNKRALQNGLNSGQPYNKSRIRSITGKSGGGSGYYVIPNQEGLTGANTNQSLSLRLNDDDTQDDNASSHIESVETNHTKELVLKPYSLQSIVDDGCFIEIDRLQNFLDRLKIKKNIILQGPPGTGKTWLAKRLAYALMEERAEKRLQAVQFHPNLSYEDFVRGWRPDGAGGLTLKDGILMKVIEDAKKHEDEDFVLVIEEVNRGNPAQIFGEMLTLLEADKRAPDEAMTLCYQQRPDEPRVFIPENVFVIGTMNIADRSLSIVDFALRRRFAFIDLQPELGQRWKEWLSENHNVTPEILDKIQSAIQTLNNDLCNDSGLGKQFQIGHNYVTPPKGNNIPDIDAWFRQVVETEIIPLLEEYWFDAPDKVDNAYHQLLDGF